MWTRTRTKKTKDGLETMKIYDFPEPCYRGPVTNLTTKELQKKKGKSEK